jgi:hypothetical protein
MVGFHSFVSRRVFVVVFASLVVGCPQPRPVEPAAHDRAVVERPADHVTIAVIGDFGADGEAEADVATLVRGWAPDFIVTTGDNNYPDGGADTLDRNVGRHYHDFIAPYQGTFGAGAEENRFFPALGNHDWRTSGIAPHLAYFSLPGNERYYEVSWGPVDVFVVDSDDHEPDGVTADSVQAQWLKDALARADGPWKLVVMHHPPYSSSDHGSSTDLQWPYAEWGATAVIAGHDHVYERVEKDGMLYLVNGLGGNPHRYDLHDPVDGSEVRFNTDFGAMRVIATPERLELAFVTRTGKVIDTVERTR